MNTRGWGWLARVSRVKYRIEYFSCETSSMLPIPPLIGNTVASAACRQPRRRNVAYIEVPVPDVMRCLFSNSRHSCCCSSTPWGLGSDITSNNSKYLRIWGGGVFGKLQTTYTCVPATWGRPYICPSCALQRGESTIKLRPRCSCIQQVFCLAGAVFYSLSTAVCVVSTLPCCGVNTFS